MVVAPGDPARTGRPDKIERDLLWRMSEILTYSSISNASRAMRLIVFTFGGDASPFVASSVILHIHSRRTTNKSVEP